MIDESIADPDPRARRELLEVLAQAFRDNPMNVAIHGSSPGRRLRANRAGLRALVLDSAADAMTRVIRHDGKVVGGFVVVAPGGFPLPSPSMGRQIGCFLSQGGRAMERWSAITNALSLFHPDEVYWYLAVLGIVPEQQGHGFGNRLLDELFRIVESDPCPVYLEADREQSISFYLARGFETRDKAMLQGVRCQCLGRGFAGADRDLCDSVREH